MDKLVMKKQIKAATKVMPKSRIMMGHFIDSESMASGDHKTMLPDIKNALPSVSLYDYQVAMLYHMRSVEHDIRETRRIIVPNGAQPLKNEVSKDACKMAPCKEIAR